MPCFNPRAREGCDESALVDMPATVENVAHVSITSVFRDADLESGTPRYHVVFEIYSNV